MNFLRQIAGKIPAISKLWLMSQAGICVSAHSNNAVSEFKFLGRLTTVSNPTESFDEISATDIWKSQRAQAPALHTQTGPTTPEAYDPIALHGTKYHAGSFPRGDDTRHGPETHLTPGYDVALP